MYVIDFSLGKPIQQSLVEFFNSASVNLNEGRFISIYGHPLCTTMVFFTFLVWTLIRKTHDKAYVPSVAVAVFGIEIFGSKSGILLALILITIYHFIIYIKTKIYVMNSVSYSAITFLCNF